MTIEGARPPLLGRCLLRLQALGAGRPDVEADLEELFRDRLARDGRRRAALRYYADVLSLCRPDVAGGRFLREAAQDLSHGLRVCARTPGAVAVATCGLALAIAVSTSIFSLLNAVALRPPGIADPQTAYRVMRAVPDGISTDWPYAEYLALRERASRTRVETTLAETATLGVTPGADATRVASVAFIDPSYLTTFGARMQRGRGFVPADQAAGAEPVVVVNDAFFLHVFNGDPGVIGRRVWLNGVATTIVGATVRQFTGADDSHPAFWAPLSSYRALTGGPPPGRTSSTRVRVVARTPPGVEAMQAQAELSAVAAAIAPAAGEARASGVRLDPVGLPTNAEERWIITIVIAFVLTLIGLILLLACVNVANLQLAGALARRREIGLRLALGAGRGRIVRQLLTESLTLGLAAGALGYLLTIWMLPVLATSLGAPVTEDVAPDYRVYVFLACVSIVAGVGAGLAPARHGTRGDLVTPLKGGDTRGGVSPPARLRAVLIGTQSAASIALLVLAALLTRAMVQATRVDIGFDARPLVTVEPAFAHGRDDAAQARAYWDRALARTRAIAGVQSVAAVRDLPFASGQGVVIQKVDGRRHTTLANQTDADFFATLGLRIVRGRAYTPQEVASGAPVAVINETLARDFWPDVDPVGLTLDRFEAHSNVTIIGIAADAIAGRLQAKSAAALYTPLKDFRGARLLIRAAGPADQLVPAVRAALDGIDPRARLDVALVSSALQKELEQPRTLAALAGLLAALALAFAVIGIYGVSAFVASQRTHEIGVRMALGADGPDVVRLLLADTLRPVAIGLGAGVILTLAASRVIAGLLYGVRTQDPPAFAAAAVLLLVSAAVAVYVPTRRVARIDPSQVLRRS